MQYIIDRNTAGDTRDQIIIGLVSDHGLTLNAATRAYADTAKAEGWSTGRTSHKDAALLLLGARYPIVTATGEGWAAEQVAEAVIDLVAEYAIAESTARDYCRAYSELLGVDHPVLDPRAQMFAWLVANAESGTKAEFKEFATELGRSPSNINEYWKGMELHRAILAAQ